MPRHGARVVRGRRDRGRDERELRQHQGRPRGAAGHRRRVHGRHAGDDRAGRLADDLLPDPGRRAVPLRHLLPAVAAAGHAVVPAAARRGRRGVAGAAGRAAGRRQADRRAPRRADRRRSRSPWWTKRCSPARSGSSSRRRTASTAGSAARRSSRRRWCWSSCCATTNARGPQSHCPLWTRRPRRWPAAACTTSSAGGFARYSVDAEWIVPHFEKMLYDNALLLRFYAHLWRRTGSATALRVATGTAEFLFETCGRAEGGFASSLDADTEGVEGLTYVWTPAQLREVLGDDTAGAELFGVTEEGTFEEGASTLRLFGDAAGGRCASKLLEARAKRPQPGRDDKVIASWNGLAITALAEAGVALDRPQWIEWAVEAAELLLRRARRRRTAAAQLARRRRRRVRRGARGLRLRRRRVPGAAPGDRRGEVADRSDPAARPGAGALRVPGRPRRVLRHRRRRRDAGPAPGRPGRQREPGRGIGAGRGAADGVRAGRATTTRRGTGRPPSGRCGGPGCWPGGCRGSPGTGCRSPKRCRPARCRSRWWARTRRCGWRRPGACTAAASCWPASRTRRASRCWPDRPAGRRRPGGLRVPRVRLRPAGHVRRGADRPALIRPG